MVFGFVCRVASLVVGALVPSFFCYKSLKQADLRGISLWCKYWCVFGSLMAVETVAALFLITYLIPCYELAKLLFLLWSTSSYTRGAEIIYDNVLSPLLFEHEHQIEQFVTNVANQVRSHASSVVQRGVQQVVGQIRHIGVAQLMSVASSHNLFAPAPANAPAPVPMLGSGGGDMEIVYDPSRVKIEELSDDDEVIVLEDDDDDDMHDVSLMQNPVSSGPVTRSNRAAPPAPVRVMDVALLDSSDEDDVAYVPAAKKTAKKVSVKSTRCANKSTWSNRLRTRKRKSTPARFRNYDDSSSP